MSQTTDQSRSRVKGSSTKRTGSRGSTSVGSSVPGPPRRRRPALTALAVLLIVGGAALAGLLAIRMDSREPVLVVNAKVAVGEQITAEMLKSTNVSGDGLDTIPVDQADQIVDKLYARQTIYPGPAPADRPAAQGPAAGGRPGAGRRTPHLGEVPSRPAQR